MSHQSRTKRLTTAADSFELLNSALHLNPTAEAAVRLTLVELARRVGSRDCHSQQADRSIAAD